MKAVRAFAVAVLAILATACASGPKFDQVASGFPAIKAGEGRVYLYRSSSMMGAAVQPTIYVNGKAVGSSKPGGFFYTDVPAGPVEVSCGTEVEKKATFVIGDHETRYVKTSVGFGIMVGRVYPGAHGQRRSRRRDARRELYGRLGILRRAWRGKAPTPRPTAAACAPPRRRPAACCRGSPGTRRCRGRAGSRAAPRSPRPRRPRRSRRLCAIAMIARTMAASSGVGRDVADERPVDLQLVDREALEVAQARVAGAEVVDRQAHAHLAAAARA